MSTTLKYTKASLGQWSQYATDATGKNPAWMQDEVTSEIELLLLVTRVLDHHFSHEDRIDPSVEEALAWNELTRNYFTEYGRINGNIVWAMLINRK